jgi:hypothetical protein
VVNGCPVQSLQNKRDKGNDLAFAFALALALELSGCAAPPAPAASIAPEARALLDEALGLMQQHSINRDEIDWPSFRAKAHERAAGARRSRDVHPAIVAAAADLGDHHSFFVAAEPDEPEPEEPSGPMPPRWSLDAATVDPGIAYVRIPGFMGDAASVQQFADRLAGLVADQAAKNPRGWIVDLRPNWGGNMWPMVAGVGWILREGVAGYLVNPGPVRSAWGYADGGAWVEDAQGEREVIVQLGNPPPAATGPVPPVAVLMGPMTGSSGEAMVLAFRGRPPVRFFGAPSAGVSSSNKGFGLSDGSELVITVGITVDRLGAGDGGTIQPDEKVGPEGQPTTLEAIGSTTADPVVAAAVRWIDTLDRP